MNKTQRIYKNNYIKNSLSLSPGSQLNPYKSVLKPHQQPKAINKSPMGKIQNKINFNVALEDIKEDQIREQMLTEREITVQGGQGTQGKQGEVEGTVPAAHPTRIEQYSDLQRIEEKIDMLMEQQIYRSGGTKQLQVTQLIYPSRRSQRDWKKTIIMNKSGKMTRIAGLSLADPPVSGGTRGISGNMGEIQRQNHLYDIQKRTTKNNKSQNISTFLMNEIPQFLKAEEDYQTRALNSRGERLKNVHEKHITGRLKTAGYEEGQQNNMGSSLTTGDNVVRSLSRSNNKGGVQTDSLRSGLLGDGQKQQNSRGSKRAKQVENIDLQNWNVSEQFPVDPRHAIKSTEPRLRNGKLRVNDNKDLQSIGEYLKTQSHTHTSTKNKQNNSDFNQTQLQINQNQNNYDNKIKNLKKMYNLSVKNDYFNHESGKTSIRNKKSRASHDSNFFNQNESAKQGKHVFSFEKINDNKKKVVGDNYSEKPNVSRSLRASQINNHQEALSQPILYNINTKKFAYSNQLQDLNIPPTIQVNNQSQLQPLNNEHMRAPMSVSSQERPLEAILPGYSQGRMRPDKTRDQNSNQKSRGNKTRNQLTLYSEKQPQKNGPLEPLKKKTQKTRNDAMIIYSPDNMIENVSDYEMKEIMTDSEKNKSIQTPTYLVIGSTQSTNNRGRNNRSPIQGRHGSGLPPFGAGTAGNSTKNKHNKFENAAARYKAEAVDVHQSSNFIIKSKTNNQRDKNLQDRSSERFLLAESKDQKSAAQVSKISTSDNQSREGQPASQQNKYKLSPYNQVLNPNQTSQNTGNVFASSQGINKRQLAQRQQRAVIPPSIQTSDTLAQLRDDNQLKVQKAYKNAVGVIPNPEKQTKKQKQINRQKKDQAVKSAIDMINLKIDGLKDNLHCYEQNIDLTLKEIPKDIRSLNNSNQNNSSSRHQNQETDRNSKQFDKFTNRTKNGEINVQEDGRMMIQDMQDDISEQTLKTILDFHSDRAQTQQRNRDKNWRQSQSHMSQTGSQLPQNMQTSRQSQKSKQGHQIHPNATNDEQILSGFVESSIQNENQKKLNVTHDERNNITHNGDINFDEVPESIHKSFNLQSLQNGRKGFNLTNMTNILQNNPAEEYQDQDAQNNSTMVYKQKTERLQKTSFTNLQAYFQQRGINNNTNLSAALSLNMSNYGDGAQIQERNRNIELIVGGNNISMLGSSNQEIRSFDIGSAHIRNNIPNLSIKGQNTVPPETPQPLNIHQNFYPQQAQSRLSQKSAIFDISASHPLSHRNNLQNKPFEQ